MLYLIIEIPRIVDHTNITGPLALGDSANLSCVASGGPLPTFQWYRDDVLLMNQSSLYIYDFENCEHENLTRSLLELQGLAFSDSGTYRCQAISIAGNASTEFKVVVMQGMIFSNNLLVQHVLIYYLTQYRYSQGVLVYACTHVNVA